MIFKDDGRLAPITSGTQITQNIGISDDPEDQAMVLNILTNSLYTDKQAAILREYACNAADANVEAGKPDLPVDIRLPNRLDPTLAIRDYGAGMDEAQITKVFCRLGKSTKRTSNAFTGMLGIGSKAGFAYGDQFMVTSFSGGTKTIYNAYRDKGKLNLSSLYSEPSKDPEGIEVKIPIREADFDSLRDKAERIFRYFKVRPNITGAHIEWGDRTQEYSGTGWRYLGKEQQSVAIMGNVGYSIDATALDITSVRSLGTHLASPEALLLRLGVELDFEIGELEVASNREGLQYDAATKKALLERLQVVISEVGTIMSGKIASAPSLWHAKMAYNSLFDSLASNSQYELKRMFGAQIMYKGKRVESSQFDLSVDSTTDPDVKVTRFQRRGLSRSGAVRLSDWSGGVYSVDAADHVVLVINDLASKKKNLARLRGLFSTHPNVKDVVLFTFMTAKAEKDYWKDKKLEGAPYLKLSTIAPQVIPRIAGVRFGSSSAHKLKHQTSVFKLIEPVRPVNSSSSRSTKSMWWAIENVDLKNDGGVYVEIEMFNSRDPYQSPWNLFEAVKEMKAARLIMGDVYGFKGDKLSKLGPNWVRLKDHVHKKWNTILKDKHILQEISDYKSAWNHEALFNEEHADMFPWKSSVRKLLLAQKKLRNPKSKNLCKLLNNGSASIWMPTVALPPTSPNNLDTLEGRVMKDYPMIDLIGQWQVRQLKTTKDLQPIADYVKMVDRRRK